MLYFGMKFLGLKPGAKLDHPDVCVVVQFYPWFKFYFLLFQTHYHT